MMYNQILQSNNTLLQTNNTPETLNNKGTIEKIKKMCIENGKRFHEKIRLQKIARDQCTGFSKERKDKKREYTRNRYHNLSEEDRQKPKEHEKNQIPGMSQEELRQCMVQLIEHIK